MKITLSKEKFLQMLTHAVAKADMNGISIKDAKVVDFCIVNHDWDTKIELEIQENNGGW